MLLLISNLSLWILPVFVAPQKKLVHWSMLEYDFFFVNTGGPNGPKLASVSMICIVNQIKIVCLKHVSMYLSIVIDLLRKVAAYFQTLDLDV